MNRCFVVLTVVTSVALLSPLQAIAGKPEVLKSLADQQTNASLKTDVKSDATYRIRLADRLPMLTQRIAASSCAYGSNVAVDESQSALETSMYEIDIILDALRSGNADLRIDGPEPDRKVVADIDDLSNDWRGMHTAVESVLSHGKENDSARVIDDQNMALLEKSQYLATDIAAVHANPFEMSQSDTMMVSLAARQRMLTQKMSKDACEIWSGYNSEEGREELVQSIAMFEATLEALRFGMPDAGILPPPTDEIADALNSVETRWKGVRGNLDALLAGNDLDDAQKAKIVQDFNAEMANFDDVVKSYNAFIASRFE